MASPVEARAAAVAALRDRWFDLLVIGGGITGCGIAREAALRGLTVALVEKDDFASGTSSRSSRLIHGGVRYLEHGHVHLVFESSAERRRLLELAPHLVRPLAFTWPVYEHARISRWKLSAGLTLYDALALFRNVGRHRRLGREAVLEREPNLRPDGLRGGALYYDASTDDARLTLANALGAAEAGAVVANHVGAVALVTEAGRLTGVTAVDALGENRIDVRARVVVNATGPWSDNVRSLDEPARATVRGSKGAHIAVPRSRIGNREALTLLSPRDGRVFFVLPDGERAVIGTTDTYTASSPDAVRATREDVAYLLDAANTFFPAARLDENDVISAWAGIRPLLPAAGSTPGSVTREHAITTSRHGLISITGGKLTTYRVMAHDVVELVVGRLGLGKDRAYRYSSAARGQRLPGGDFESVDALLREAARATGDPTLAAHLVTSFGSRWRDVLADVGESDARRTVEDDLPYTFGELRYCAQHEMAWTLGDLLFRRTRLAYETGDHGLSVAERVATAIGPVWQWDAADRRRAVAEYEAEVLRVFSIDSPERSSRALGQQTST